MLLDRKGTELCGSGAGSLGFETPVLNNKIDNCDECKLTVKYSRIKPKKIDYCAFEGEFILVNETTQIMEIQFLNLENQVTFVPSSFILNPGQNIIHTTILPINGYMGNSSLTMIINGTSYDNDLNPIGCEYTIKQFIPECPLSPRPSAKVIEKTVANIDFAVQLSPNPVTNDATIRWTRDQSIDQLRLYDLRGQLLSTKKINSENIETTISLEQLPQGTYMLTVWSNNEFVTYFKIIKK